MNLLWTKAHPTQSQIENLGLRPGELYLNKAADFYAGKGAAAGAVPDALASKTLEADALNTRILGRLLAIQREVLFTVFRDPPARVDAPVRRKKGDDLTLNVRRARLRAGGHDPVVKQSAIWCTRCTRSFSRKGQLSEFWPCRCLPRCDSGLFTKLLADEFHPNRVDPPMPLGGVEGHPWAADCHPSHILEERRGMLFCVRCGCICVHHPRNLRDPCQEPTDTGKRVLSRLRRGLTPKSGMEWPER